MKSCWIGEQIIKDLEERILILEKANADMKDKAESGLRKEVQLREVCDMLMGKKSEKFVPESSLVDVAIQQTLGSEFDTQEIKEIISIAVTPTDVHQANQEIIKGNRKKKRHHAHIGEEYSHHGWKFKLRLLISMLIKRGSSRWVKR